MPKAPITPSKNVVPSAFKDPAILAEAYRNPLGYRKKPRLGTALELLRVTAEIEKSLESFAAPFLVLHGTKVSPIVSPYLWIFQSSTGG